jgi:hypothetical protein
MSSAKSRRNTMGKTYMHVNKGDTSTTVVARTDGEAGMNTYTVWLGETTIYLREEAFDDLLAKMQAAKADWDKRMAAAAERRREKWVQQ